MNQLHFAAAFGRSEIVDELLDRGATVDKPGEWAEHTPLHMAAEAGHVDVMRKLLLRGADPNKHSQGSGLVLNSAILSGKQEGVELLVERGVSLGTNKEGVESPFVQAATIADISMVEYLIQNYSQQLSSHEISNALVSAAAHGRTEIFNKLLQFAHNPEEIQSALRSAIRGAHWEIVSVLLESGNDLNCDEAFFHAATGAEDRDHVLETLWEYSQGCVSPQTLSNALYDAADRGKDATVELLLGKFGADPNATGDE